MTRLIRLGVLTLLACAGLGMGASAQQKPATAPQDPPKSVPAKPAPAQVPARPAQNPSPLKAQPALPGAPWASPVLPPAAAAPPVAPKPAERAELELKPDPKNLIDCKDAPRSAVLQVPAPLSRWATIYCTKQGHLLTSNEAFYSTIPGTGGKLRGVVSAAQIAGRTGEVGHSAFFTKIGYAPLSKSAAEQLTAGIDPALVKIVKDKPLAQLELTAHNGQVYRGVLVDPDKDPFWVLQVRDGKIVSTGFIVATVDYMNKRRAQ
jgi:hypothetical protein